MGGTFGGSRKPTEFMCLVLKLLQIQPDKEIVVEYIKNEDYKYVRLLGEHLRMPHEEQLLACTYCPGVVTSSIQPYTNASPPDPPPSRLVVPACFRVGGLTRWPRPSCLPGLNSPPLKGSLRCCVCGSRRAGLSSCGHDITCCTCRGLLHEAGGQAHRGVPVPGASVQRLQEDPSARSRC